MSALRNHRGLFVDGLYLLSSDSPRAASAPPVPEWVMQLPVFRTVAAGRTLSFSSPVTVISGENGTGKSTFLEALAYSCHFPTHGGPWTGNPGSAAENHLFGRAAALMTGRPMAGWFLRAESHHRVGRELGADGPGVRDINAMSHGQSVVHVIREAFHASGLYLLDEPESGLSAVRQMALMAELHRIAELGAQVIVATHSPIVAAVPGAAIWEIDREAGIRHRDRVTDTVAFQAMEDFLADPAGIADYMVDVTADDTH